MELRNPGEIVRKSSENQEMVRKSRKSRKIETRIMSPLPYICQVIGDRCQVSSTCRRHGPPSRRSGYSGRARGREPWRPAASPASSCRSGAAPEVPIGSRRRPKARQSAHNIEQRIQTTRCGAVIGGGGRGRTGFFPSTWDNAESWVLYPRHPVVDRRKRDVGVDVRAIPVLLEHAEHPRHLGGTEAGAWKVVMSHASTERRRLGA